MAQATFSGNANYVIDVDAAVQSQNQAGNYSTIYWRVIVHKTWGTGFFGSGSGTADSNVGGNPDLWNASFAYDFRNGASTGQWTYASGTFNVGHDANGYGSYFVNGGMSLTSLGQASAGTGWRDLPRIPKTPAAPAIRGLDQITPTSMRIMFEGFSDGGSAIQGWQVHYGLDPSSGQFAIDSSGTSTITGLLPSSMYYFWARGRNGVGWGPWSARANAMTLSAARVRVNGVYTNAIPYVKHEGVYKMATPYIKSNGAFRLPG